MGAQGMSPSSDNESNARKRVCKACDRCRLKKSKVCPTLLSLLYAELSELTLVRRFFPMHSMQIR